MKHFKPTPEGEIGTSLSRHGSIVSTGWRRVTPALMHAEHLADQGAGTSVEKGRAVIALKRIGARIGLKPADVMLIDTLAAFSQPQDWEASRRPVIWPSNARLMVQTGFSLSALKRHLRRLAEAGVIAFHDSPNGKRWGQRGRDGHIIEGYGFDLSPLAARAVEFEVLHEQLEAERATVQRLRRQITVARRSIRGALQDAFAQGQQGPWAQITAEFDALLRTLRPQESHPETLAEVLERFEGLMSRIKNHFSNKEQVLEAFEEPSQSDMQMSSNIKEMDPSTAINDPHLPTTNQLQSVKKTELENRPDQPAEQPDMQTALNACPEFLNWLQTLGDNALTWTGLHRSAARLAQMIGIPDRLWAKAQHHMGGITATASVMLVFEKHASGEVTSPGGYLRGMIRKAQSGDLHLNRSFHGRLAGMRGGCLT